MKRLIIVSCITFLLLIAILILINSNPNKTIMDYLEEKYGEKFSVIWHKNKGFLNSYSSFSIVYPENGNNVTERFYVYGIIDDKTNLYTLIDDYYKLLLRDEYESILHNILAKYFEEYKVFVKITVSDETNKNQLIDTIEKAKEHNILWNSQIDISVPDTIEYTEEEFTEKIFSFIEEIETMGFNSNVYATYNSYSHFETINRESLYMTISNRGGFLEVNYKTD